MSNPNFNIETVLAAARATTRTSLLLTDEQHKLLQEYAGWTKKAELNWLVEMALMAANSAGKFIGTYADDTGANAVARGTGFTAGFFYPGDMYYNSGSSKIKINTASGTGSATWTNVA